MTDLVGNLENMFSHDDAHISYHFIAQEGYVTMLSKSCFNLKRKKHSQIKTRIDIYETLCPQQMLVHKGGKIKNWVGECRDVTPTKLQSQNIFKEHWGVGLDLGEGSGWM